MIKSILYVCYFVSFLLGDYLFTKEAAIYAKYPMEVSAGSEFTIEITIEKGNLSQFGRYQHILPEGFTATSDSKLFEFSDQKVKFIWVTLPAGNTFTFSYKIQVPATFTGDLPLNCEFAYILDNERKVVKLNQESIKVQPAGYAINSKAQYSGSGNDIQPPKENIYCYRQIFKENGSATVKLLLHKDDLNSMAKIIEKVPAGFVVESDNTNSGIFTFSDNTAKFMWMNLPSESEFVISYTIKPIGGASIDSFKADGELSYSVNNITQTIAIIDKDFEKAVEKTPVKQQVITETTTKQTYSKPVEKTSNVQYKIQIAASHKMVNTKRYFKKYRIDDKVSVDLHDGWHKYMIKQFFEYKEAKEYRDKIWKVTPVDDAFVTAYNNNQRITVQEALMITNQKWYK